MTKHPEVTHSSSSLGSIKPMGLRFFKVALCDLKACSSDKARLIASSWARVLSLMSFWSARISFTSSLSLYSSWAKVTTFSGRVENVSICRIATNALVILMLVSSATGLRSTLDSIKAPSSGDIRDRHRVTLWRTNLGNTPPFCQSRRHRGGVPYYI